MTRVKKKKPAAASGACAQTDVRTDLIPPANTISDSNITSSAALLAPSSTPTMTASTTTTSTTATTAASSAAPLPAAPAGRCRDVGAHLVNMDPMEGEDVTHQSATHTYV
jgi:hypothetical protein